jgi:ATP-dependent exoDNAse (exonuclease V) beta subunit
LSDQGNSLVVCRLAGKSSTDSPASIAEYVEEVLANASALPIVDRDRNTLRNVIGKDISILCRTNERCEAVAIALSDRGIKSACQRTGLLHTTECILAFAALRYLVDGNDSLAMAEILHLTQNEMVEGEWLSQWLAEGREQMRGSSQELLSLDEMRSGLTRSTPAEALDTAISAARVVDFARRWGNARTRLSNLDAMRGLASRFEDLCLSQRRAATPAGLVTFMYREVSGGGGQPPSFDDMAVQVLTYHGSKGLEFPVVILLDLDSSNEPGPFGVFAETAGGVISARDPLKDRWIRFWPWPYGLQRKNVHLDATADGCAEMIKIRARDNAESTRLLYVGSTRARDYLVLGCTKGTDWLDSLTDTRGAQVCKLPTEEGSHAVQIGETTHQFVVDIRNPISPIKAPRITPAGLVYSVPADTGSKRYGSLRIQPSSLSMREGDAVVDTSSLRVHNIGSRFPFSGTADMQAVGDAMHSFLAADQGKLQPIDKRLALARRILSRRRVCQLEPECLVEASDRLNSFIEQTYPQAVISRECAVFGNVDGQRIHGRIDLLLETPNGIVVVDHKTFPGAYHQWIARAGSYRPQLAAYADVASRSARLPMIALLVHLPIVGTIVDVTDGVV